MSQPTDDDLELLREEEVVEGPRRILGGSIASFLVLVGVAVAVGTVIVVLAATYGAPIVRGIAELLSR